MGVMKGAVEKRRKVVRLKETGEGWEKRAG
jgi:hypothetical protein